MAQDDGFLSRWSRRKVQVQKGLPLEPEAPEALESPQPATLPLATDSAVPPVAAASTTAKAASDDASLPPAADAAQDGPRAIPPPTLHEAQQLAPDSPDFSRFVARGVDPQVQHTALKTLFSDPHFNVMDRLDTYIDDYNTPDPLPAGMLRKMMQSSLLGLFDDEPQQPDKPLPPQAFQASQAEATTSPPEPTPCHEDPAVRLQPNDDAGPAGDQPGPGEDPGRQL